MDQTNSPDVNALPEYGLPPTPPTTKAPSEPARIGPMGRLIGVLFSPGETYQDINRKPTWIVPVIISCIVTLAFSVFLDRRVQPNYDKIFRKQIVERAEKSG